MRKFVALFVLLLLPLQLTFAAGAEYCEIEKGDTGHHFGHHVHLCKADADSPSKGSDGDSGCGFCHLGCAQAQASAFTFAVEDVTFAAGEQVEPPLPPSHTPPGIDRPPRSALA